MRQATTASNQYVETRGRRIGYRSIGEGKPVVLCTRFRGTVDLWDPLFLDTLADRGFRVITFDYTGLGLSTGSPDYDAGALARDVNDLIVALELQHVVIAGWSLGGLAAQVAVVAYPERITHAVLLATGPAGAITRHAEPVFVETSCIADTTFEQHVTLFFEPRSPASRAAAKRSFDRIAERTEDRARHVPIDFAVAHLHGRPSPRGYERVLDGLRHTAIPILHVGGDHDIAFPIENWYALNPQLPSLQLLTYPRTGHAPHHQHPVGVAHHIATFIRD